MPSYFEYDKRADAFKIHWRYVGDLDTRAYVYCPDGPVQPRTVQLEKGKECEIPDDATAVISCLVKPWKYHMGCPEFTDELLNTP